MTSKQLLKDDEDYMYADDEHRKLQQQISNTVETLQRVRSQALPVYNFLVALSYLGDPTDRISVIGCLGIDSYEWIKPQITITRSFLNFLSDGVRHTLHFKGNVKALISERLVEKSSGESPAIIIPSTVHSAIVLCTPTQGQVEAANLAQDVARDALTGVMASNNAQPVDVLIAHERLGDVYKILNEPFSSLKHYQQALGLVEFSVPADNIKSVRARLSDKLGWCFQVTGDCGAALNCFRKVLDYRKEIYGNDHLLIAHTLDDISSVYIQLGHLKSALNYSQQTYELISRITQPTPSEIYKISAAARALATCFRLNGDLASAKKYIDEAVDLTKKRKRERKGNAERAHVYAAAGEIFLDLFDSDEALRCYEHSMNGFKRVHKLNVGHVDIVASLFRLGTAHFSTDNYKPAKSALLKAYKIAKQIPLLNTYPAVGVPHVTMGGVHVMLGATYLAMEDMKKAVKHLGEAKKLLDKWSSINSENSTDENSAKTNDMTITPLSPRPSLEHAYLLLYLGLAKATQNLVDDAKKYFEESRSVVELNIDSSKTSTTASTPSTTTSTPSTISTSTNTSSTISTSTNSSSPRASNMDEAPHPILIQLFRHRADVSAASQGIDEGVRYANRSLMMLLKYGTLTPSNVRARAFEHVADFCAKIGTSEEERTDGIPSTHAQTMTSKAILYYSQAISLLTNKPPTAGPNIPEDESPLIEIDFNLNDEEDGEAEDKKEPSEGGLLEQQHKQERDSQAEVASIEAKLKYLQETAESPAIGKDQCIFS